MRKAIKTVSTSTERTYFDVNSGKTKSTSAQTRVIAQPAQPQGKTVQFSSPQLVASSNNIPHFTQSRGTTQLFTSPQLVAPLNGIHNINFNASNRNVLKIKRADQNMVVAHSVANVFGVRPNNEIDNFFVGNVTFTRNVSFVGK